jgi:hypothetical protein
MKIPPLAVAVLVLAHHAFAQVPAGPEFRVNAYTYSNQWAPRAAFEPDGDFVVVWESVQDGDSWGIVGQRFDASGVRRGGEFIVNAYTTGPQTNPAVAVGPRGDFFVVWYSDRDGSGWSVHGRRFHPSGMPNGGEFQVNTYTTGYQYRPRIGRDGQGRFVVVWTSSPGQSGEYGVFARRFDATGAPLGDDFRVNTYTTGPRRWADVSVAEGGDFIVVWYGFPSDGSNGAVLAQRFDATGNRLGMEFVVNTHTPNNQLWPAVNVSPGGIVVAWTSFDGDGDGDGVRARLLEPSGIPRGADFIVNTYTSGSQQLVGCQIGADGEGNFVIAWDGPGDDPVRWWESGAFLQRFDASGARRGAEFAVNSYTTGIQAFPSVSADSVGNLLVVWESDGQDGSGGGIYARRFGGLQPAALQVDTGRNGVLEPGESIDLRPSWRNVNGAAQTFSATLADITGPAGAAYAIIDGAGDYGAVPNGATAPCVDCYGVSVSNPPSRPALHWDASALESIVPDAQGQQKKWLLHIGDSFADVPRGSGFYSFVETLLHHGVTGGCGPTTYCPSGATSREQMAVFVLVAKEGAGYAPPTCATPMFADVPATSGFCPWIEELARRGVVSGCGGGNYCPGQPVSREQMAVFVLRTLDPAINPPACLPPNLFDDVPETNPFCPWIEELANRSIVTGCVGLPNPQYCPSDPVTREQMGVFIGATFGLELYGP